MSEDLKLEQKKMPEHIAIIMDGNGRWAKNKGMLRTFGHQNSIKAVRAAIEFCDEYRIPYLTLYAFSSENWNRPALEVNLLMNLLVKTIRKEVSNLKEKGIRVKTIGNSNKLPQEVSKELDKLIEETKDNRNGTLILALSYGAKEEIIQAVQRITLQAKEGELAIGDINEELFEKYLYTEDIPSVDLLIRTSGEQRISNFLLWQIAYAELYFTDVLWPDFSKEEFFKAIKFYQSRERRFGKTSEQLK